MKNVLLVGLGGFVGSVLRFGVGAYFLHFYPSAKFPWATLAVNLAGCFAVGVVAIALERVSIHNSELRLLLITGFMGGFTTFSAFGLETFYLFREELIISALLNIGLNVILGIVFVYLGLRFGQLLLGATA